MLKLGLDALGFEKNVAKQDPKGLEIGKTGLKPVSKQQRPKEFTVPKPRSGLKFGKYLDATIWTSLKILQNQPHLVKCILGQVLEILQFTPKFEVMNQLEGSQRYS